MKRHLWTVGLLVAALAGGLRCAAGCDEVVEAHVSDGGTEQVNACSAAHLTDGGYVIPEVDGGVR